MWCATMQKHAGEKHKTGNYIIEGTPADPQHCVSKVNKSLKISDDLTFALRGKVSSGCKMSCDAT